MAGPQCCENPPTLTSWRGDGAVEEIGGLNAYIVGSTDSTAAVILISDIYGYEAPNLRKLADKVAASGFYAVVPDFFTGDPYSPLKYGSIQDWLKSHNPEKGYEAAKTVVEALKRKGISATGATGVCWLGCQGMPLSAKAAVQLGKASEIKAAMLLHPSFVTPDDIKATNCHIAVLGAEVDNVSPPELVKQFEEVLSTKPEIDSFVKIYPGTAHGWTVRYNAEDEVAVKKAEEAHFDMMNWLTAYVN